MLHLGYFAVTLGEPSSGTAWGGAATELYGGHCTSRGGQVTLASIHTTRRRPCQA